MHQSDIAGACHGVPAWSHDSLVRVAPLLQQALNWHRPLVSVIREEELKVLHGHEHTDRPLGDEGFLASLEQKLGRILRRQKPEPKGQHPSRAWCPRNLTRPQPRVKS